MPTAPPPPTPTFPPPPAGPEVSQEHSAAPTPASNGYRGKGKGAAALDRALLARGAAGHAKKVTQDRGEGIGGEGPLNPASAGLPSSRKDRTNLLKQHILRKEI